LGHPFPFQPPEHPLTELTLDFVLDTLEQGRQRATYRAVAGLLGKTPRTLMRGQERGPRHSWIVNRNNGLPTGYDERRQHPDLALNAHVINSREELESWIASGALRSVGEAHR
jgi:hypothetical protein